MHCWIRLIGLGSLLALVLVLGCSPEAPAPAPASPRPNVVLVTIDTLRADRLEIYGAAAPTMPFLATLAKAGVVFDAAFSTSSWTVPAVASLLTSLHPEAHGITTGTVNAEHSAVLQQQVLPDSAVLFAEVLQAAGYRTFAVTANLHLAAELGFAQGFDRYRNVGWDDADAVATALAEYASHIADSEPYFLWLHLFDPHAPYTPQAPWIDHWAPDHPAWTARLGTPDNAIGYRALEVEPGTEAMDFIAASYRSELAFTDDRLRRMFEVLGVDDDELIVVTADHGEAFLEHGTFGHGFTLFDEELRVPLVVRLPGAAHGGTRVRHNTSLIDVLPTVIEFLGIEGPAGWQGTSRLGAIVGGEQAADAGPVLASLERYGRDLKCVVDGRFKYIHDFRGGGSALFDRASDPTERSNIAAASGDRVRALHGWLVAEVARARAGQLAPSQRPLSAEDEDKLRALGYLQ